MTRPLLAALLVLALGVAACGSNKKEEAAARKAVGDLYTALAAKDGARVCNLLSNEGRRQLARAIKGPSGQKQTCANLFEFALAFSGSQLKNVGNAKVTDVSVDGDKARAKVKYNNNQGDVVLVKEAGKWKLSGLGLK
jgi:hypothetical protein